MDLFIKTDYNAVFTEIEVKIPCINGLATAALNTVKNEIHNTSDLVKRNKL